MTNEELCRAYQAGDLEAAEWLIEINLSFVRSIAFTYAKRFPFRWMDVDDFTQEGCIAFLRAVEHYSSASDASFLTYAGHAIRNGIMDVIRSARSGAENERPTGQGEDTCPNQNGKHLTAAVNTHSSEHNPENLYLESEKNCRIRAAIASLSQREAAWIRKRYGLNQNNPMPVAQVARLFHISISRAQRLEKKSLAHLKQLLS